MRTIATSPVAAVLVALSAIIGAIVLGALHDLDPQVIAALLSGALALAGGSAVSTQATNAAVNGKATVSPELLQTMQETLRQTIDHLSGARAQIDQGRAGTPPDPPGDVVG